MSLPLGEPALEDLLGDGLLQGAAALVISPPEIDDAEVGAAFLSEGLGRLDGGILVQTRTADDGGLRERLAEIDPHLADHETDGRLRYVTTQDALDALAIPRQLSEAVPTVRDFNALTAAVNRAQRALDATGRRRIVIDDLDALLEATNRETVARFLQVFVGRVWRADDVALVLAKLSPDDPALERLRQGFDVIVVLDRQQGELRAHLADPAQRTGARSPSQAGSDTAGSENAGAQSDPL